MNIWVTNAAESEYTNRFNAQATRNVMLRTYGTPCIYIPKDIEQENQKQNEAQNQEKSQSDNDTKQ